MMKPLNRVERNNAFLGFVVLFSLTIGIVIAVVFFSIEVPFTENTRLRSRVSLMQREQVLSDTFRVAMDEVLNELGKFDSKEGKGYLTYRRVHFKLKKMENIIKKISVEKSDEEKSMYDLVIQNLSDLNEAKFKISNLEKRN